MINFNNIIGTYYFQKNMLGIYLSKFRQYYLIDNEDDIVKEIIKNKSAFTTYRIVSNNFFFIGLPKWGCELRLYQPSR